MDHPLSATSKAAGWSVPDFSLESRRLKAATTQALSFAPRAVPALFRPPDEEKGRAFRSRAQTSSSLFGGAAAAPHPFHNKLDPPLDIVEPLVSDLRDAFFPTSPATPDDQDDDDLLEQYLADKGVCKPEDDDRSGFVESPSWTPRRAPGTAAPLPPVSAVWTRAIDYAVFNADGNIQLSGQKLREVPNAVWELSTLRSFSPSSPSRSFSRTQSVPASQIPASPARRLFGRTSTVAFGSPGSSAALAAGAVPVILMLSGNELTAGALSNALWTLSNLQVLSLRNNLLDTLPEGVGRLTGLRELSLAGNQLQFLPAEILQLENLTNLTLHPNPWLRPTTVPGRTVHSGPGTPDGPATRKRRRRRLLGPLVTHFSVPSLVETCTRILLSETTSPTPALAPASLSASTSSYPAPRHIQNVCGGVEYVRALLEQRSLFAPFYSTFYPPSSLAASASSSSTSSAAAFSPALALSPSTTASHSRMRELSSGSAASVTSTPARSLPRQPFDPASHVCHSPAHAHEPRGFVHPAVERLEWVSEARLRGRAERAGPRRPADAGIDEGALQAEVRDIPVRWRGCGPRCLDWLEEDENVDGEDGDAAEVLAEVCFGA